MSADNPPLVVGVGTRIACPYCKVDGDSFTQRSDGSLTNLPPSHAALVRSFSDSPWRLRNKGSGLIWGHTPGQSCFQHTRAVTLQ